MTEASRDLILGLLTLEKDEIYANLMHVDHQSKLPMEHRVLKFDDENAYTEAYATCKYQVEQLDNAIEEFLQLFPSHPPK